jgi:hypothetical protein
VTTRIQDIEKDLWAAADELRANSNLRQTRDLLLPRLISGELDVSQLDIVGLENQNIDPQGGS